MKKQLVRYALLTLALGLFGTASPLLGDVTGTILGTVIDPSGGGVPGAVVRLSNANTGLTRTTTTDSAGGYEFLAVPVGEGYVVEVEKTGFAKSVQSGLKLLVNQKFRADFKLELGSLTQTVRVSAQVVQVEATSTQLGDVIESPKMTAMPLNGRSFLDLLGLQSGVVPLITVTAMRQSGGDFSVNGQRESANAFLLNGGDIEHSYDNGTSIQPNLDSIEEFRLLTSTYDAEYGHHSGAVVNIITKSGGNGLHGSVFEFLRNNKLDSRGFFDRDQVSIVTGQEIPGSAVPKLDQNQFGGTFGGPIKKNRLFFFVDYQGSRTIQGVSTGNDTVPSLAERQGNFSDVGTTGYAPLTGLVRVASPGPDTMDQVLSQRLGYNVKPGEPYWVPGCNSSADADAGMCVFPGQVIPQSAWSPAAKGTLPFIPQPTFTAGGVPYYSSTAERSTTRDDKFGVRVDLSSQRAGNWTFYYHLDDASLLSPSNPPGFSNGHPTRNQNVTIGNTRSFGPSAVNVARLSFTRSVILGRPVGGFGDIKQWGFQEGGLGIIPASSSVEGVPYFYLTQLGLGLGVSGSYNFLNAVSHASDNFTKMRGKHTVKLGAEFGFEELNQREYTQQNGLFGFFGDETGNDLADYLIGTPSMYIQGSQFGGDARTKYFGSFAQDSFKVKTNFTVNYGLRYDVSEPFYERHNAVNGFVAGEQSRHFPNSPEGYVFPGDPGVPRSLSPTRYNNFAPRVGLAYSPGFTEGPLSKIFGGPGKTSVRLAFGIFYTTIEAQPENYQYGDAPFGLFYVSPTLIYFEEPFLSRTSTNEPGQRFPAPIVPSTGSNISFATFLPISGTPSTKSDNVLPRTNQYNFTIERQITASSILTLAYIGSQGHHLIGNVEINPGDISRCLEIAADFTAAGNPSGGCGPSGEDSIYTIDGQTFNGTRPYSVTSGRYLSQGLLDFGGDNPYASTLGNSNFNSFEASLQKSAGPMQFLAGYTFSKSLDNVSGYIDAVNPYNSRLSKALSTYNMTQNFVISYECDLPFHRLARSKSGAVSKVVGGWSLTGITRFTTGQPVLLYESGDRSLCGCPGYGGAIGNGVDLPNYNGQPIQFLNPRDSATHQYFSTAPFSPEAIGVPGNANRRFFSGPGLNNWDFALLKQTRVSERVSIQFRAEFFNLFNHAQFNNPAGDFSSASFGGITGARSGRIGQMALKLIF